MNLNALLLQEVIVGSVKIYGRTFTQGHCHLYGTHFRIFSFHFRLQWSGLV